MLGPMLLLDVLVLRLREFVDEPSSGRRGVSTRLTLLVRFGESRPQPLATASLIPMSKVA